MKLKSFKNAIATAGLIATATFSSSTIADTSVWKVTKGDDHVYIGGTVHILPVSEFPLPKEFTNAYQESDSIVLEAKLPDPTDANFQAKMMKMVSYTEGKKLSSVITPDTFNELETYLAAFGFNLKELDGFKPGFVVTMMAMMEAKRAQLAGEGVDKYFDQLATKDSKPKEYLESVEFQLNMLASMGEGAEEDLIKSTLSQMGEFKQVMTDMLPAWRSGDEKLMDELIISKVQEEDPATFKTVFTDRNKNWIPQIEKMFNDNDKEFVLVGVGHLVGDDNVIQLLEKKGYQVSKL